VAHILAAPWSIEDAFGGARQRCNAEIREAFSVPWMHLRAAACIKFPKFLVNF
jgi:hypothetical protein